MPPTPPIDSTVSSTVPVAPAAATGRRRWRQRRGWGRVGVLAALAMVVWAVPALGAAGSSAGGLLGPSCAAAAGPLQVGLVVDFGSVDSVGAAHPLERRCVSTGGSSDYSGFSVLTDGGHTYRISGSGLLCAIDGYPATGCGERTASGYKYWSYWHGGSSWTYSSAGPAYVRPNDGSVEGWHYVDGGGNPTDPPPGASPASPCPTAPPATTPPPGGSGGSGSGGPAGSGSTGSGSNSGSTGGSTGGAIGGSSSAAPPGPGGATDSTPSTEVSDSAGTDGASDGAVGTDDTAAPGSPAAVTPEAALGASAPASSPGPSGPPVGVIVVALAVVALGVSAAVRFRRRAES